MALELYAAATGEPLTLALVQQHVKLPPEGPDDQLLEQVFIPAARQRCELATRRQLRRETFDLKLDAWPEERFIELPRPPLVSVTSVQYYDTAGVLQALVANTDYTVSAPSGDRPRRGRIALKSGVDWPALEARADAIVIRFVCGYASAAVPGMLKAAMLLDVATLYAGRENAVAGSLSEIPQHSGRVYRNWTSYPRQALAGCA